MNTGLVRRDKSYADKCLSAVWEYMVANPPGKQGFGEQCQTLRRARYMPCLTMGSYMRQYREALSRHLSLGFRLTFSRAIRGAERLVSLFAPKGRGYGPRGALWALRAAKGLSAMTRIDRREGVPISDSRNRSGRTMGIHIHTEHLYNFTAPTLEQLFGFTNPAYSGGGGA